MSQGYKGVHWAVILLFGTLLTPKGGFKSEGRGGFSQLSIMSAKKTIQRFRKWKFGLFFAFTGLIYFQVLQIGSRNIINQLIKPVNAKKSAFSFLKSQDSFFGTHFGQLPSDLKPPLVHKISPTQCTLYLSGAPLLCSACIQQKLTLQHFLKSSRYLLPKYLVDSIRSWTYLLQKQEFCLNWIMTTTLFMSIHL